MSKKIIRFLVAAVVSFATLGAGMNAFASDIQISPCPKDPSLLYIEITGESAMQIYSYTAKRLNMALNEVGGVITNDMICSPQGATAEGFPTSIKCSYVMSGKQNLPYPQIDPGYSHEAVINCQ